MAMYGATIGKLGLLERPAATNQACAALLPHSGTKDLIPFVFNYLRFCRDKFRSIGQGGAQPNISLALIKSHPCPLPPLNEQKRIVAKIEALQTRSDAAKQALDAIPPLLEKFRQSVLAAAFRGDLTKAWREAHRDVEPARELLERIRAERRRKWEQDNPKKKYVEPKPVDPEGLPELPHGWCWARWEEIGTCQNGRAFPSELYCKEGTKLLRPGNLHISGRVEWDKDNTRAMPDNWATEYPNFLIGPGELVMNLTAQSLKDEFLGRVCLTGDGERCLLNQRIARLTPVIVSVRFCLWLFKADVFRQYVQGLNTGSLIQHMFTSQVYDFILPLPPKDEHEAIVSRLEEMLKLRESVSWSTATMADQLPLLNQSILAKAFRGELVPQDPNDEPASALLDRIRAVRETTAEPKRPGKRGRKSKAPQ